MYDILIAWLACSAAKLKHHIARVWSDGYGVEASI